jgi:hypothetical protein
VPMDRLDRAVEEILTGLHNRPPRDGQTARHRSRRIRPLRFRLPSVRRRW